MSKGKKVTKDTILYGEKVKDLILVKQFLDSKGWKADNVAEAVVFGYNKAMEENNAAIKGYVNRMFKGKEELDVAVELEKGDEEVK